MEQFQLIIFNIVEKFVPKFRYTHASDRMIRLVYCLFCMRHMHIHSCIMITINNVSRVFGGTLVFEPRVWKRLKYSRALCVVFHSMVFNSSSIFLPFSLLFFLVPLYFSFFFCWCFVRTKSKYLFFDVFSFFFCYPLYIAHKDRYRVRDGES